MNHKHKHVFFLLLLFAMSVYSYAQDFAQRDNNAYTYVKSGNKYIVSVNDQADLLETLKDFCEDQKINAGIVSGLGSVDEVTLRVAGADSSQKYTDRIVYDQMVITGLTGSISLQDNELALQVHATLVRPDYSMLAGRLTSAIVNGTSEIIVEKLDADFTCQHVFKYKDY